MEITGNKVARITVLMAILLINSLLAFAANGVVISEVLYNPQGPENKEWIELYNPTDSAVDISGWKIYSFSALSADATIPNGRVIQPRSYFLIGDGRISWEANWPEADYYEALFLTNTNSGIKLTDFSGNEIDKLGWGSAINIVTGFYETEPHTGVSLEGNSLERIIQNCAAQDTGNNAEDFVESILPPKNSSFICVIETCGNDNATGTEVCDGSDLRGNTCQDLGYSNPGNLECNSACTGFDTSSCSAVCGNNITEPGEQCDDGNLEDDDGCSAICKNEVPSDCGNNAIEGNEVCDSTDLNGKTCINYGYSNPGNLACNSICSDFDISGCSPVCGDGKIEPGETCDDSNLVNGDGCSSICETEIADDLMINYLRGKITFDGVNANKTKYTVEVLTGENAGKKYEGFVDDGNVFFKDSGNFDTNDQLMFSTGTSFKVVAENCDYISEGIFINGGNKDAVLDCKIPPVINDVSHKPEVPNDLEDLIIIARAADNIGIERVFVHYSENKSINQTLELGINDGKYEINLGTFGKGTSIDYYIQAIDTYGSTTESVPANIDIVTFDEDKDGFNSSVDCNDLNNAIYPGAEEVLDDVDQNCNNDAPMLVSDIENKTWEEDSSLSNAFDLDDYFSDLDNAKLNYEFSLLDTINVVIDENNSVSFSQPADWNGIETIVFTASDGINSTKSNEITLNILAVNDMPYFLNIISDVVVKETEIVDLNATGNVFAADVDGDNLVYSYTCELPCTFDSGKWQTNYGDVGAYEVNVTASDGILSDSQLVNVTIVPALVGDVNKDAKVNILDLILVRRAFGITPVSDDWKVVYDVNKDDVINILDLIIIRQNFT